MKKFFPTALAMVLASAGTMAYAQDVINSINMEKALIVQGMGLGDASVKPSCGVNSVCVEDAQFKSITNSVTMKNAMIVAPVGVNVNSVSIRNPK